MNSKPKKMAILTIKPEELRDLLRLPDGTVFIEQRIPFDEFGVLEIKVEGAGWYTREGAAIMKAEPAVVTKNEGGRISVDWRLPEE